MLKIYLKRQTNGEDSKLFQTLVSTISEYENVYMEIGMQTGILLNKNSTQTHLSENVYKKMYDYLFHEVSKGILMLMNNDSTNNTVQILKMAQCRTEEIYINSKGE